MCRGRWRFRGCGRGRKLRALRSCAAPTLRQAPPAREPAPPALNHNKAGDWINWIKYWIISATSQNSRKFQILQNKHFFPNIIPNFNIFEHAREIPSKCHQSFEEKSHFLKKRKFKFCTFFFQNHQTCDAFLLKFWSLSGAKVCASCRSRKMLKNAPTFAIVAVHTAWNDLLTVRGDLFSLFSHLLTQKLLG